MSTPAHRQPLHHGPLGPHTTGVQRHRRLPLVAKVTQRDGQTTHWRAVNVSEGGIFVRAAPTVPVGSEVEIEFCLPGSQIEIAARARVVWTNDANQPSYDPTIPYGMGMHFMKLNPVFQELIRLYVAVGSTSHQGTSAEQRPSKRKKAKQRKK